MGTLTEVEGNINSAKYIGVLDTNLWPVIAKNFEISHGFYRKTIALYIDLPRPQHGKNNKQLKL